MRGALHEQCLSFFHAREVIKIYTKTHITILYLLLITLMIIMVFTSYMFEKDVEKFSKRLDILETSTEKLLLNTTSLENKLSYNIENDDDNTDDVIQESEIDDQELRILSQLIEAESGTQSFEGKLAVGTVVMNRVESGEFPNNIRDVIFQKNQFSPVANGKINNEPSEDSVKAAKMIMEGTRVLNPNVLYFYNPKLVRTGNWIRGRKPTKVIGDHTFTF